MNVDERLSLHIGLAQAISVMDLRRTLLCVAAVPVMRSALPMLLNAGAAAATRGPPPIDDF